MDINSFSISKDVFDSSRHLCLDGERIYWSDYHLNWHFSEDNSSLKNLFKIAALELDINGAIPEKYFNVLKQLNLKRGEIPLKFLLNKNDLLLFGKNIVNRIKNLIKEISAENINYYQDAFIKRNTLISSLQSFRININLLQQHLNEDENSSNRAVLSSFLSSNKIEYNNYGTKTGRLTVTDGPNILNLKRKYRNIFESRYGKTGKILSIDFSSLETRLLLMESGKNISGDIYQKISDITKNRVDREVIKKTIISLMYGASDETLIYGLPPLLSDSEKRVLIKNLHIFFKIEDLLYKLRNEKREKNKITNRFGFCVKTETEQNEDGLLLNYYLQSTGADFCLSSFYDFLEEIDLDNVHPLFIIHDSLVLDVHENWINKIKSLSNIYSKDYDYNFPVKVEEFTNV